MSVRVARALAALVLSLALTGCLLTPGKFTAKLTINADRSFAFSYVGEVIAIDPAADLPRSGDDDPEPDPSFYDDGAPTFQRIARRIGFQDDPADAERDRKLAAIAEALRKEAGYRTVEYVGDGMFRIDYAVTGRLTHNFIYPFNIDAQAIVPFVAVELRANGTVRVRAPAFGDEAAFNPGAQAGLGGGKKGASKADGVFTLDTDAEIVSQNSEEAAVVAGNRRSVAWTVTPITKAAPMAVLKLAPAP